MHKVIDDDNPYRRARGFWGAVNRRLFPVLGPAQVTRRVEPTLTDPSTRPCPLCSRAMSEHVIERTAGQSVATRLHCP